MSDYPDLTEIEQWFGEIVREKELKKKYGRGKKCLKEEQLNQK